MEINAELQGVEESLERMSKFVDAEEMALEEVIKYILQKMFDCARNNIQPADGAYEDHTSNLRDSISININTVKEYPADTDRSVLKAVAEANKKPVIKIEGDDYYGVLSAGMEYAIWVELTSGYWVLQGAIDKFEPLIDKYFSDYLSVEKLDLIQAADIQYAKFLRGKGLSDFEIENKIRQKHQEYGE